jgi:NAD(P)-dependent dehydrogenase (short-subunit alcohol dehydrogenase family)
MSASATSSPPHNRIALVTGAGSGIGLGCAAALVADGWRVVYTGRRIDTLQAAIARAGDPFGDIAERALAVPCDVGDEASVDALFTTIGQRFGRLDLLFNNAGVSLPGQTPDEIDAAAWRRAVDTNLNGAFFCLAGAFKMMRAQSPMGGRIINNGSISAHAVTGLTRAASLDGRAYDIAVGQIDIGNVASDMTERMVKGVPQADGSIRPEARMDLQAVVDSFMTMARLPLGANVLFMTVLATKMPFVGRG